MTIIQVNRLNTQLLQTLRACHPNILWIRPDALIHAGIIAKTKLGRKKDVFAFARPPEPFPDNGFTVEVDVGRVPESLSDGVSIV